MLKKVLTKALVVVVLSSLANVALGANVPTFGSINDVIRKVCNLVDVLFTVLLVLVVVFVIFAAYNYLTSGGNPEKVKSANQQLIYAAVAILVGIVSKGVPVIVGAAFGVGGLGVCFNLGGFTGVM